MAILTSHLLNGADGTHAGNVTVELVQITTDGTRTSVFTSNSDDGGRFREEVSVGDAANMDYEMVIASGAYFADRDVSVTGTQILREIVIRFAMPDPNGHYHIPVIMSPNSYSCWWSS